MATFSRLLCSKSKMLIPTISKSLQLFKWRLSLWVSITGASGFLMISPAISPELLSTFGGIFLCSGAAQTFNQIIERDTDTLMSRTCKRPLPSRDLTPAKASLIGMLSALTGGSLLYFEAGWPATSLALTNIGLYTLVYTPLKRRTEWNTHIGSLVGAIPPLIGCFSAGSNLLHPEPWLLFGIMYVWQIPHFYSLAWINRKDYLNANLKMYGIHDESGYTTATASVRWICLLVALPLAYNMAGFVQPYLAIVTFFPNLFVFYKSLKYWGQPSNKAAASLFVNSLWHILILVGFTAYYVQKN